MRTQSLLRIVVAFTAAATFAKAQAVLTFDGARCYSGAFEYWLTGNGMVGPLSQLTAHGYSVSTTSQITSAGLAGKQIFVCGELQPGTSLSASEASDLQAWIAGGGSLLYLGEGDSIAALNTQIVALVSAGGYGGTYNSFGVTMNITAPTHPLIAGPFGTVTSLSGLNAPGSWVNTTSGTTIVAQNPSGTGAVLALTYGSGRVVLVNDSNYFSYPPTYSSSHAIFWDNTIDWLAHTQCTGSIASYCTAGTTTHACVGTMAAAGLPSAAATSGFTLTCSNIEGQKNGLVFYGVSGANAVPWGVGSSSTLCVKTPTQRTTAQTSGGTLNLCDGSLAVDFLAFMAANPTALGQPIAAGQQYHAQAWFRDPPSTKHTALSDGLSFVLCP